MGAGETAKIALNEWPLSGARIASLNVRYWATVERELSKKGTVGEKGSTFSESIVEWELLRQTKSRRP
jgi:hypothetical protein